MGGWVGGWVSEWVGEWVGGWWVVLILSNFILDYYLFCLFYLLLHFINLFNILTHSVVSFTLHAREI